MIPPLSAPCLHSHCDSLLSQLHVWSFFCVTPAAETVGVYLSDYDFSVSSLHSPMFGEGGHLYTDVHRCILMHAHARAHTLAHTHTYTLLLYGGVLFQLFTLHGKQQVIAEKTYTHILIHEYAPTNRHTHTDTHPPGCFESPPHTHTSVWGSLETSQSWESCLPIRRQQCVTIALVSNLLFCLKEGDFLR